MTTEGWGGARVMVAAVDGLPVATGDDALTLIGDALGAGADLVAIPTARLHPGFLNLSTRMAGEVIQKFTNYRVRLAIVGDIDGAVASSNALSAFVIESNRGPDVWFVSTLAALRARLEAAAP